MMDASKTSVVYWAQKFELTYCTTLRDLKQEKFSLLRQTMKHIANGSYRKLRAVNIMV